MLSLRNSIVDWNAFGQWVTSKQQELRISDRELARRSKISVTHIGYIRRGMTRLGDDKFLSLVEALGATESEAKMAMKIEKPELSEEEQDLLLTFRRVPDQERPKFMSIAKAAGQAFASASH